MPVRPRPSATAPLVETVEEERRRRILVAALELFVEKGYSGTSMEALAEAADSHKRELYRLFASKKDLFREAVALRCRERLTDDRPEGTVAPTAYLTLFGHRLIQMAVTPRTITLQRAVIADLDRHPKLGAWLLEASQDTAAEILVPKLRLWHRQGRMRVPEPRKAALDFIRLVTASFNTRAVLGVSPQPSRREMGKQLNAAIEIFLNSHG